MRTIEQHVGAKIRERRTALSLSIGELATELGCTELELIAHEAGHQRIKPDKLAHLCRLLDAEFSDIFEGFVADKKADVPSGTATVIDLESRRKPGRAE